MKARALTTSEVAQIVMEMFPSSSKVLNMTAVYDNKGTAVIFAEEPKSGKSKVRGSIIPNGNYSNLKSEEKKEVVEKIKNLEVDIVTYINQQGNRCQSFYLKGEYTPRHWMKEYEVKPFNY